MKKATLYVRGFSSRLSARDLAYEFERFGPLVRCDIPRPKFHNSDPFAFVEFEDIRDAEDAYDDFKRRPLHLDGRRISIEWAKRSPRDSWRSDGERSPRHGRRSSHDRSRSRSVSGSRSRRHGRSRSPRVNSSRRDASRSPSRSRSPRSPRSRSQSRSRSATREDGGQSRSRSGERRANRDSKSPSPKNEAPASPRSRDEEN